MRHRKRMRRNAELYRICIAKPLIIRFFFRIAVCSGNDPVIPRKCERQTEFIRCRCTFGNCKICRNVVIVGTGRFICSAPARSVELVRPVAVLGAAYLYFIKIIAAYFRRKVVNILDLTAALRQLCENFRPVCFKICGTCVDGLYIRNVRACRTVKFCIAHHIGRASVRFDGVRGDIREALACDRRGYNGNTVFAECRITRFGYAVISLHLIIKVRSGVVCRTVFKFEAEYYRVAHFV